MNQIDNIMALADRYAHAHAKFWLESLYGTSKPYTADCKEEREEQQQTLRAAIEQALTPGEPVAWRELCRRLYVELWHCDQQMTHTYDEEGEQMWTTGKTVSDVLRDAKAALDTAPPAPQPQRDDTALLRDALYVIHAWENGCDREDYWPERHDAIAALRERLK